MTVERRRRDDLFLCPSTLLPDTFDLDGAGFEEYVEATVAAGAVGISFWTLHEVLLTARGWTSAGIRARLSAAGLRVACVEAIYGWANVTSPAAAVEASRESLAGHFRARRRGLNAAVTGSGTRPLVAEGVGFEPTVTRRPQRLSRPPHSSALATFRRRGY